SDLDGPLFQAHRPCVKRLERRQIIGGGQPHRTRQAFVGMIAWPSDNEPATTANRKGLPAYAFAYQLYIRVVGLGIAFDRLPLIVDGFACACGTFEFLAQLCITFTRIDLRHPE